jgi:hypothetical protein
MDVSLLGQNTATALPAVPSLSGVSHASDITSVPVLPPDYYNDAVFDLPQSIPEAIVPEVKPQVVKPQVVPRLPQSSSKLTVTMDHAHPMVHPEEKEFLVGFLQTFPEIIDREGGFVQYMALLKDQEDVKLEEEDPCATPEEMLRRSTEIVLRQTVRNGSDSISVRMGGGFTMGMKKVAQFWIELKCEDFEISRQRMSIFWDWDVKLEQSCEHAEC